MSEAMEFIWLLSKEIGSLSLLSDLAGRMAGLHSATLYEPAQAVNKLAQLDLT
jgi:hypothetical protein